MIRRSALMMIFVYLIEIFLSSMCFDLNWSVFCFCRDLR